MMEAIKNNKIVTTIKKHRRVIDILLYCLVFLSLFFACFFQGFAYVSAVIICLTSLFFFNIEKNICLLLIISCFGALINTNTIVQLSTYTSVIVCFVTCLPYLVSVIKRQKKLNFKLLIPIFLFLIYIALPIHKASIKSVVNMVRIYGLMYVVYECRKELSIKNIIKFFAISLLIACFFALFRNLSPRLDNLLPYVSDHKYLRFSALYGHPNSLAVYASVVISALLFLKYKNKISLPLFLVLFIPLLCAGFCTLSRNFYLVTAVAFVVFAVFHIVKSKKNFWKLGLTLILTVILCCGMCFIETKIMLVRFKVLPEESISDFVENSNVGPTKGSNEQNDNKGYEYFSDEWWEALFNGEINYDPGRVGIAKNYLKAWSSSTKSILFGKGISGPKVGVLHAHNMFIQELYTHGIVGIAFYLVFLLSIINFKGLKNWKKFLSLLILILPYLVMVMFEAQTNDTTSFILFTIAIGLIENEIIKGNNKVQKRVLYYSSSFEQDKQNENIINLIKKCNEEKFAFDIVTNSTETESKKIVEQLGEKNINVYSLGKTPLKQNLSLIKFLVDKGEMYDVMHIDSTEKCGYLAYLGKDVGGIDNVVVNNFIQESNKEKPNKRNVLNKILIKNYANNTIVNLSNKNKFLIQTTKDDTEEKSIEEIYNN